MRELGGLDAAFEVAMNCHSDMEVWACMFVWSHYLFYTLEKKRADKRKLRAHNAITSYEMEVFALQCIYWELEKNDTWWHDCVLFFIL